MTAKQDSMPGLSVAFGIGAFITMMFGGTPLLASLGIIFALTNAIPLHTGTVDNDGYNVVSLSRSPEAREAFWIQMKVNQELSRGKRLRDLPDVWFRLPSDEAMENSMVAAIGVFGCNRLMDQQRLEEADARMAHLLELPSGMVGIHRNLLICDRMYLELIGRNRKDVVEGFRTRGQRKFMKAMGTFPSVIRTEYA